MEEISIGTVEAVFLGSSIAFSGLFYYLYRKKRKAVDKLSVRIILFTVSSFDVQNQPLSCCLCTF